MDAFFELGPCFWVQGQGPPVVPGLTPFLGRVPLLKKTKPRKDRVPTHSNLSTGGPRNPRARMPSGTGTAICEAPRR